MADELSRRNPTFGSAARAGATTRELIARVAFAWALAIGVSLAASAAGAWIGH
jgi:hypothetical protein